MARLVPGDKALRRVLLVEAVSAAVLVGLVVVLVYAMTGAANSNAREVAKSAAEEKMRCDVDNVISRIESLEDKKASAVDHEISHLHLFLADKSADAILGLVQDDDFMGAFEVEGVEPRIEIRSADGETSYRRGDVAGDSDEALFAQDWQVDGYRIMAFSTQADIDDAVKSQVHDEIYATKYGPDQYVWVNEVVNYDGGDNYAIRRIHPNLRDTEGIYLSTNLQDAAGAHPYESELEGIKANGELFQSYYFKNLSNDQVALKYSYAKLYKPFNWIVATGVPLSNLYAVPNELASQDVIIRGVVIAAFVVFILAVVGVGFLFIRRDTEVQRAREHEKDLLLSRVSHDMRTPMNAIVSYSSEEFVRDASREELEANVRKVNVSAHHLMTLIDDLLTMSSVENHKFVPVLSPVTLRECFQPVYDMVLPRTTAKYQTLTLDFAGVDPETCVSADVERVRQVMVNLVNNACKYTPEHGSIAMVVSGSVDEAAGRARVVARVSDTGMGIPADKMKVVFEPFSQLSEGKTEGIGLGLSIVKTLVSAMGGTVEVSSKVGRGTTFVVTLDLALAERGRDDGNADGDSAGRTPDEGALAGLHMLVCEDSDINAEIAEHLLRSRGIVCTRFENGRLGLEAFAASSVGSYDAILMDMHMPVMGGIEAARAIRALKRPDAATIPIIAMTADVLEEDVRRCLDAGMDAHVAKPIDSDVLFATLSRCISRPHS